MEAVRHPISSGLFNKDENYVRGIEAAVEELYEREFAEQWHTPLYALRLKQDYPEPCKESLLFKTQLLAPNRLEQQDGGARRAKSAYEKTRQKNPAIQPGSYYRPASAHPFMQPQQPEQLHHQHLPSPESLTDDSYKYGRPTRASILRNQNRIQSAPVTIQEERRQDKLRAERLERKRCISANQVQRELAERKSGRVTGETFHAFLVGARYNSANYIDRRAIDRYGMYLPRSNPAECFGRPDRLPTATSLESPFASGAGCLPSSFASGAGGGVTSEDNERLASVLSMFSGADEVAANSTNDVDDAELDDAGRRRLVYSAASEAAELDEAAIESARLQTPPPPPPPPSTAGAIEDTAGAPQGGRNRGPVRSAPQPVGFGIVGRSFEQQPTPRQQQPTPPTTRQRRSLLGNQVHQQLQDRRRTPPSIPRGAASLPAVLGRALQQPQAPALVQHRASNLTPSGTPRRVVPAMPGTYPAHLLAQNSQQPHQQHQQQQQQQQRSVSFGSTTPISTTPPTRQSPRQSTMSTNFRPGDSDIERMFAYVETAIAERNYGARRYQQQQPPQPQQRQQLILGQVPSNTPRDGQKPAAVDLVVQPTSVPLHLEELVEVDEETIEAAVADDAAAADERLRISVSLQPAQEVAEEQQD